MNYVLIWETLYEINRHVILIMAAHYNYFLIRKENQSSAAGGGRIGKEVYGEYSCNKRI